jgi:hypothetical protein
MGFSLGDLACDNLNFFVLACARRESARSRLFACHLSFPTTAQHHVEPGARYQEEKEKARRC